MSVFDLVVILSVMTLITFTQKYVPFVAFSHIRDNVSIKYLGEKLPGAVMLILVLFTLKESTTQFNADGMALFIPSCIATIVTALVHILFRQVLISIFLGVMTYGIVQYI